MTERAHLPAPTAAPLFTALGVAFVLAGLVTHVAVSAVGAALFVAGAVGWFREVLPREHEVSIAVEPAVAPVVPSRRAVLHLAAGEAGHRARLPLEVYPYSAGLRGGVAGGIAMALLAVVHGLLSHGSPWYTVNLLAAAASARLSEAPVSVLVQFQGEGFVLALVIHAALSVLVGLLYGALLPMVPGHPVFWGGVVAPLLWTGLIAASLEVINPALSMRIDWGWFVATQIAFGIVAGVAVARSERIATFQHAPLVVRAGLETQDEEK
jgi:hypothetical protein